MSEFRDRVKPLIADIPGWLTDEEGEALYELARSCRRGNIVEIGSWRYSTASPSRTSPGR